MTPRLANIMAGLNADVLKAIAKRLNIRKPPTRKADLIDALGRYLDTRLSAFVKALSPVEKQFLAEAAYNRGMVDAAAFEAKYDSPCPEPGRWVRAANAFPLLILIFEEHGLEGRVCIPREVGARLRKLLPKPAPLAVETADDPPAVHVPAVRGWHDPGDERPVRVHEGERIALQELRRVLGLVQAGKLRVTAKSKRPTDASARLVSKVLIAPDFDLEPPEEEAEQYDERAGAVRAHAWGVVVQQCGWAKPRGGKLALTKEGKELLGSATPDAFVTRFMEGVGKFMGDDGFDEFNRINHVRGQSGKAKRHMTDPSRRKAAIRASMRKWPPSRWMAFDAVFRFTFASGNAFDVCPHAWHLYFDSPFYGNLDGFQKEMSRQYLRAFLLESMATLGLVDVAYAYPHRLWPEMGRCDASDQYSFCGRYDGLLYVRLNPFGAYCLGLTDEYEAPPAGPADLFRVLPNLEIALTSGSAPSAADLSVLKLFARRKSDYVYGIDGKVLLNYLESGGAMEDVVRFLEAGSSEDIPETVHRFLADVEKKASAVKNVEDAILVELVDPAVAALIASDARTRKYCERAGERRLAVPKKNERAFRTAVKKLGYIVPPGA